MLKKIKRYAIVLVAGCVLIWVGLWAAKKFAPPVYYKIAANVTGRDFVVPGTVDPVVVAHPFWRGANLAKIQKQLAAALTETFRAYWKSTQCDDLVHGDPEQRKYTCPSLMAGTVEMVWGILHENGISLDTREVQ